MYAFKQVSRYLSVAIATVVLGSSYAAFAYQDNDNDGIMDSTISQSSSPREDAAALGLVTPSTPTIDSIDGTGVRRIETDPGTLSIDGTGLHSLGQEGTESIDGTGRALSAPAENLAESGQSLRTLDGDTLHRTGPAVDDCAGDSQMAAGCDSDEVDGE